MDRRVVAAAVVALAVVLAGCPQNPDPAPTPRKPSVTPEPSTPAPSMELPPTDEQKIVEWRIARIAGSTVENGVVEQLVVVLANPSTDATVDLRNAVLILQHDGQTYRVVHETVDAGDAAGQFSTGEAVPPTVSPRRWLGVTRALAVDLTTGGDEEGVPLELTAGDTAAVLLTAPNTATDTASVRVPSSLSGEAGIVLSGEFAADDRSDERTVHGKPRIVAATGNHLTDAGAGVVNLTVTKLPGSAPVDYRQAIVRIAGPGGTRRLVFPSQNATSADGHFGFTTVRDPDGSAPVMTDGDRFTLTLDLGTDSVALDDGPAGDSVGTPLDRSFSTRVALVAGRRTRTVRLALPAMPPQSGPVALRGVVPRDAEFPRTRHRPTIALISSADFQVPDGDGIGGLSINVLKPPTANPLDPREMTVVVTTPNRTVRLVHSSRSSPSADGHFAVEHRFNPDGSTPVLDDYFDFARLTVDVGVDGDGPPENSVGERILAGTLVTVTVKTEGGVGSTRQYYVP